MFFTHNRIAKTRGFTLIELLMVIAIISLLSSVVIGNLNNAREKGRIAAGQKFSASLNHAIRDELLGEWMFENDVNDSSGAGHNGTINGNPAYVSGVNGSALSFDGNDDIDCVVGAPINPGKITVGVWINIPDGTAAERSIVETGASPGGGILLRASSNSIHWWFNTTGNSGSYSVALSGWKYVAVTHDYSTHESVVYVDGVLVARTTDETVAIPSSSRLTIGSYSNGTFFMGEIDDLRIYGKTLTSAQIQQYYAEGLVSHPTLASK